jgi:asparagine synthase (glutamine-hydrolysing)
LIAAAQSVAEGFDPLEEIPTFSPLIVPALVETCLRIPSWMWFKRGCNRAIARHALSGILPPELAWRRSKGAPDGFIANLYESNRSAIRTMLLGGALQAFGLLDRSGIQSFLDDDAPVRGHDYLRIMQLVDAEAWARNWS